MQLSFIFMAMVSLFSPGLALVILLRIKSNLTLNSIALSYSLFFLVYLSLLYTGNLANYLLESYLCILIISLSYLTAYLVKNRLSLPLPKDILAPLAILTLIFFYTVFVGAYTEIPSDLYTHLERYQFALNDLSNTHRNYQVYKINLLEQGYGWYYFLAMLSKIVPVSTPQLIESVSFVTNSVFIICIYFFTQVVFNDNKSKKLIALATCLLTCLHMGINVFSFIRYYALAPTLLGFCLYMTALSALIEATTKEIDYKIAYSFLLISIFIFTGLNNHTQEALFTIVMSSIIIFVHTFKGVLQRTKLIYIFDNSIWFICAILIAIGFICAYYYAHINLPRSVNEHWNLWEFGYAFGLIPDITTLNLKFKFIRVITLWGCLVYLLFLLNWRRYKYNVFIIAGMISPIFTILNPFFADLFLRFEKSTTFWRLTYMIPIHFVAADLLLLYIKKLWELNNYKKIYPLTIILLLVGLLMPINNTWEQVHYSRITTLKPTQEQTSLYYYEDVLKFLDRIKERKTIVTDPITGYIVSSSTRHRSPRYKFFRSYNFHHFSFEEYNEETLSKYRGYLLIVNQRKQPISEVGRLSGHWSHRELTNISNYYPEQLITHLNDNSLLFEKMWSSNGISIYQIN